MARYFEGIDFWSIFVLEVVLLLEEEEEDEEKEEEEEKEEGTMTCKGIFLLAPLVMITIGKL